MKVLDIKIGDYVKAYDFEPMPCREDNYIVGKVDNLTENSYLVTVAEDTMCDSGIREKVEVPMQDVMLFDFDNRVTKLPSTYQTHLDIDLSI